MDLHFLIVSFFFVWVNNRQPRATPMDKLLARKPSEPSTRHILTLRQLMLYIYI